MRACVCRLQEKFAKGVLTAIGADEYCAAAVAEGARTHPCLCFSSGTGLSMADGDRAHRGLSPRGRLSRYPAAAELRRELPRVSRPRARAISRKILTYTGCCGLGYRGGVNPSPKWGISTPFPSIVVLNADDTFGLAAGRKAMEIGEQQHRVRFI